MYDIILGQKFGLTKVGRYNQSVSRVSKKRVSICLDFTMVMSVANCKDTWQIFHEVQQETLLLIALTETNCPRLPSNEAVMVSTLLSVNL